MLLCCQTIGAPQRCLLEGDSAQHPCCTARHSKTKALAAIRSNILCRTYVT